MLLDNEGARTFHSEGQLLALLHTLGLFDLLDDLLPLDLLPRLLLPGLSFGEGLLQLCLRVVQGPKYASDLAIHMSHPGLVLLGPKKAREGHLGLEDRQLRRGTLRPGGGALHGNLQAVDLPELQGPRLGLGLLREVAALDSPSAGLGDHYPPLLSRLFKFHPGHVGGETLIHGPLLDVALRHQLGAEDLGRCQCGGLRCCLVEAGLHEAASAEELTVCFALCSNLDPPAKTAGVPAYAVDTTWVGVHAK